MRNGFGQYNKLRLGLLDTSLATFGNVGLNPGTVVNSGVSFFGGTLQFGSARAAVNIGPPIAPPGVALPFSLEVMGISNMIGITNFIGATFHYGVTTKFGMAIKNALSLKNGVDLKQAIEITNGPDMDNAIIRAPIAKFGLAKIPLVFGRCTGNKGFDVPHPTVKGKRVRHICVEGPESAVYVRGVLGGGKNVIEIPDYWQGLVDMESITVQLTPIGTFQELFVQKMEWGKNIIVRNNAGGPIHCSYHITAARHINPDDHTEKLHVVYDGESPKDYPGDNDQYSIAGYHYDRKGGK